MIAAVEVTNQISVAFLTFLTACMTGAATYLTTRYNEARKQKQLDKVTETQATVDQMRIEQVDAPTVMAKQWTDLLEQQQSILAEERKTHADERARWLTEAEAHREQYEDRLAEVEEKVARMQRKLDEKDVEIAQAKEQLDNCHERIGRLNETLRTRDETITDQNETIRQLRAVRLAEEALLVQNEIPIPDINILKEQS